MTHEVSSLLESHRKWLGENTSFTILDGNVEINLPFLDHHNDYIQIYLTKKGKNYILSDDGETINDLKSCGMEFTTAKRQSLLRSAIVGFRVTNDGGVLKVEATAEDFGFKMNRLIQAILAVNDLLMLLQPARPSDFHSNVEEWLKKENIEFSGSKRIVGKSGVKHSFDFTLESEVNDQPQMIKLVNRPSMDAARKIVFTSIDMPKDIFFRGQVVALLNDPNNSNLNLFGQVLRYYSIGLVHWSKRDESLNGLKSLKSTFRENDQLVMNF